MIYDKQNIFFILSNLGLFDLISIIIFESKIGVFS